MSTTTAPRLGVRPVRPLARRDAAWRAFAAGLAQGLEAERQRLALWLPLAIGAGVLLYFALPAEPPAWAGLLPLLAGSAVAIACWRWLLPRAAAVALAAAALGLCAGQLATWRALPVTALPSRAVLLTGTVRSVELLPGGRRITLAEPVLATAPPAAQGRRGAARDGAPRTPPDAAPGLAPPLARTVRVRLRANDAAELAAGDTMRVRALLRAPAAPSYPGARDLQRDAYFSGLAGSGFALGPSERLAQGSPSSVARWWQGVRDAIAARILTGLPGPDGAIAATLLTGTSSAIPEPDRAAFRDSGLAHLLAVAGLHIGIVMGLVMGATRFGLALWERAALRWPTRQIAALTALAAGGLYMLLTGMHLPILRSFAMASLATLGLLLGRRAVSLRALALAACVLLLASPQELLGVSFQMSFSAVLALIAGYEALRPALAGLRGDGSWQRRTALHGAGLALTSLLAGTASAPFAAAAFGHVQLYFIAANMLAVPLTALWVMPLGLATLALMPLGLERLALLPMGWGIAAILWIGRTVSAWPAAILAVPPIPGWGLLLVASGMAWLGLLRVRARWLGAVPLLLGLCAPLLSGTPDLLVSADARLIGLRADGQVFLEAQSGASRYVREDWLALWDVADAAPLPADAVDPDVAAAVAAASDPAPAATPDGARVQPAAAQPASSAGTNALRRDAPASGTTPAATRDGAPPALPPDDVRAPGRSPLEVAPGQPPVAGPAPDGATTLRCDAEGCVLARAGTRVLVLRRGATAAACDGLALLVSPEPARGLCPDVPRIDRFSVWRDGAQAVRLSGGRAEVLSDRAARGQRPWVPPEPGGHAAPALPAAASE